MADLPFDGFQEGAEADPAAEAASRDAPVSGDAVAVTLALEAARADAAVAARAATFLERQTRLVEEQIKALASEDPLAPGQLREGRMRRSAMRMRNAILALTTILALALAAAASLMIYGALASRSVVVEAFEAPPALAARGVTGKTVAAALLDQLLKLRDATRSASSPLQTRSAWSEDIKIQVPETGVSIGEIERLLHERLGRDLHVSGELAETDSGGLALTVRGGGVPAKTFEGGAGDLARLVAEAAEHVYGRSQPYQFAVYLASAGRDEEAVAFLRGAFARADDDAVRAELANVWGLALQDLDLHAQAAEKFRLAMSLQPRFWKPWSNLPLALIYAEGEEAAWRESQAFLRAVRDASAYERPPLDLTEGPSQLVWDMPAFLAGSLANAKKNGGAGAALYEAGPDVADVYSLLHDWPKAERYLAGSDPEDSNTKAETLLVEARQAIEGGRAEQAVAAMEAFRDALKAAPSLLSTYTSEPCLLGLAYAMSGRAAEAEAAFAGMERWAGCRALHGDALELSGASAAADREWAAAEALAPDLPSASLHRGRAEMARGDLAAAASDLSVAHAKAPRFADPLKSLGDVLMLRRDPVGALARYEEASRYAPAWTALQQARDSAAGGEGRP